MVERWMARMAPKNTPTSPAGSSSKPRRNQPSSYSAWSAMLGSMAKKARMPAAQKPLRIRVTAPPAHRP